MAASLDSVETGLRARTVTVRRTHLFHLVSIAQTGHVSPDGTATRRIGRKDLHDRDHLTTMMDVNDMQATAEGETKGGRGMGARNKLAGRE